MNEIKENNVKHNEDFQLVQEVINGNNDAFGKIQKKYYRIISSIIRRMIKDEDDVMDLAQETFIKAYKALPSFKCGFAFSSWLYKIASNCCIDFLRKKRLSTISLTKPDFIDEEESEMEIEDNSYIPDMNILSQERKSVLLKAINDLPDNYKEILRLRHEEDLDYVAIAETLSIPLGTVKAHLFRARKILYSALKNEKHLFY